MELNVSSGERECYCAAVVTVTDVRRQWQSCLV